LNAEPKFDFGPVRTYAEVQSLRLLRRPTTLFFHARDRLSTSLIAGHFKLLGAFASYAHASGLGVEILHANSNTRSLAYEGGHLHVLMEDEPLYLDNCFHCVPGYLRGYWYFDEVATRNNSTIRLRVFDPRPMNQKFADEFLARLQQTFVAANKTKYPQEERGAHPVAPGSLAFFAQDFRDPQHHRHYMHMTDMIDAAVACKGTRRLYIKPHPKQSVEEMQRLQAYHDPQSGVFVTSASIHDLLEAADVALTLTSAVGFEAFLHRVPVVLGGQTDFAQNAVTLTNPAQLGAAIDAALAREWPFAKFLVWFLRQNCLEDTAKALPQLLEKVYRKGYAFADLDRKGFF